MSEPPEPPRVRLEYFAAEPPFNRGSRRYRATFCWAALALGWLPFTCGVISSQAVARSGVAETVIVHHRAGTAFMACGMIVSIACMLAFLSQGNRSAALLALLMLAAQVCLFLCVGGV